MGSNINDDWDTDPDFIRDMDETHQRWGNKRTVGSIDMNDLINQVNREHKSLREKYQHPSQRGTITGYEKQESISRKVITETSEKSYIKEDGPQLRRVEEFTTRSSDNNSSSSSTRPPQQTIAPKPAFGDLKSRLSNTKESFSGGGGPASMSYGSVETELPKQFKESNKTTKRIFEQKQDEAARVNSPPRAPSNFTSGNSNQSKAFKSIQDKIDAFKREFENIEHKVAKQSDLSRVIKKSTNVEKSSDNMQYVTRSNDRLDRDHQFKPASYRPISTSPNHTAGSSSSRVMKDDAAPKASIKSLSERFESLGRETSDDFKRRMEERRKDFFEEIKTQVRQTRKGLDGFDIIDSDDEDARRDQFAKTKSGLSSLLSSPNKPKVYTERETTKEQIQSRFVRENDKVLVDETKRNVERSSSRHGSSDEDDGQQSSIKFIERELKSASPLKERTQSPIDEIKRRVPVVEPTDQGSGLMARTLYDHQAAESDELSFDVDELITNIEKLDQGWYKGTITRSGRKLVGLFPANYVKLLNDSSFY